MDQTTTPGTPEALNALLAQIAAGTAPGSADPATAQQDEDEAAAQGQAGDYAAQRWYEQTAAAYRAAAARPNFSKGTCRIPLPIVGAETVDGRYVPHTDSGVVRCQDGKLMAYWAGSRGPSSWAEYAFDGDVDWPVWAEATVVLSGLRPDVTPEIRLGAREYLKARSWRCEKGWSAPKMVMASKEVAAAVAGVVARVRKDQPNHPYECPRCHYWHLTSTPNT